MFKILENYYNSKKKKRDVFYFLVVNIFDRVCLLLFIDFMLCFYII